MLTLTYGYKLPQTNDKGPIVFPAMEFNIQRLNDHDHDGVDSVKIPSSSVLQVKQTVLAAGWVATSGGTYRVLVTIPPLLSYDDIFPKIKDNTTGHVLFLSIEKVSNTQMYVYSNDNTLDLAVYY